MKPSLVLSACAAALLAAGCASYSGRGLEPGTATESDVLRVMGKPTETLTRANGDKRLYYSRQPEGREIYAATIAPDGRLRAIDQTLVPENIRKVTIGVTAEQVRDLLGPPYTAERTAQQPYPVWEYRWMLGIDRRVLWVSFNQEGVAREVTETHDYTWEPNTGSGFD
jgi:hypothetical protein